MVSRRTFIQHIGKGIIFIASYPILVSELVHASDLEPTPANTEGPYYSPGAPVKIMLREKGDTGTLLKVSGSLVDTSDRPINKGLIEIWHTDPSGRYDLNGFRYRAATHTTKQGQYEFETFMPGNYGGRPRHIHYKITAAGFDPLVTQLYFENDPFFEGRLDQTIQKDPLVQYRQLIRPVVPFQAGKSVSVNFKICLARDAAISSKILLERPGLF
jgi:protocatechuate 3,4-dioxygenase beta subunit